MYFLRRLGPVSELLRVHVLIGLHLQDQGGHLHACKRGGRMWGCGAWCGAVGCGGVVSGGIHHPSSFIIRVPCPSPSHAHLIPIPFHPHPMPIPSPSHPHPIPIPSPSPSHPLSPFPSHTHLIPIPSQLTEELIEVQAQNILSRTDCLPACRIN